METDCRAQIKNGTHGPNRTRHWTNDRTWTPEPLLPHDLASDGSTRLRGFRDWCKLFTGKYWIYCTDYRHPEAWISNIPEYPPPNAIRLSWLPSSAMRPFSRTRIRSAIRTRGARSVRRSAGKPRTPNVHPATPPDHSESATGHRSICSNASGSREIGSSAKLRKDQAARHRCGS